MITTSFIDQTPYRSGAPSAPGTPAAATAPGAPPEAVTSSATTSSVSILPNNIAIKKFRAFAESHNTQEILRHLLSPECDPLLRLHIVKSLAPSLPTVIERSFQTYFDRMVDTPPAERAVNVLSGAVGTHILSFLNFSDPNQAAVLARTCRKFNQLTLASLAGPTPAPLPVRQLTDLELSKITNDIDYKDVRTLVFPYTDTDKSDISDKKIYELLTAHSVICKSLTKLIFDRQFDPLTVATIELIGRLCPNLRELSFGHSEVTHEIVAAINKYLPNINRLTIRCISKNPSELDALQMHPQLKCLEIRMYPAIPLPLIPSLREIVLQSVGDVDCNLKYNLNLPLQNNPQITKLSLSDFANAPGRLRSFLSQLPSLTSLNISDLLSRHWKTFPGHDFGDEIDEIINSPCAPKLREISLKGPTYRSSFSNPLTNKHIMKLIENCPSLTTLDLTGSDITPELLKYIESHHPRIRTIYGLDNCPKIPKEMLNWPRRSK